MPIGSFKLPINNNPINNKWTQEGWQIAYNTYQRPNEWLPLPTVNLGEEKIVLLNAIFDNDLNLCSFSGIGSNGYTVDWGDGVINNYSSGIQANHIYNFSGFSGSVTSFGYKQNIVTITPQSGGNLLSMDFNVRHSGATAIGNSYSTNWLDCRAAGANFTSLVFGGPTNNLKTYILEMFEFIGPNNITTGATFMFLNCFSLGKIVSFDTSKITDGTSMFNNCNSLLTIPLLDFSSLTNGTNMFASNVNGAFNSSSNLITIPQLNLSALTNATTMFNTCRVLSTIPELNLINLTNGTSMFANCASIETIPQLNLSALTNGTSMFNSCRLVRSYPLFNLGNLITGTSMFANSLVTGVPLFDLHSLTNGTSMFAGCAKVTTFPQLNLSAVTNGTNMFFGCATLRSYPLFDLGNLTNGTGMFTNNTSLTTVPLFDFRSLTNATSMFVGCINMTTFPLFNLSALTNGTSMFQNCKSIKTFPLYNFSSLTGGSSMFNGCGNIRELPFFDLHSLIDGSSMFNNLSTITGIPQFNLTSMTNGTNMFSNCGLLETIPLFIGGLSAMTNSTDMFTNDVILKNLPLFDFRSLTTGSSMFNTCRSLTTFPAFNFSGLTTTSNMFINCYSNSKFLPTGLKVSFDLTNGKLSKSALEVLFNNLTSNVTAQTVTITNNWGANPQVSLPSSTTTSGNTTITQVTTSALTIGMRVTGTGIDTSRAVTLQTTGNTVTLNNHGISNGKLVYFASIVTTTGIIIKTPYYVVNSSSNTFQLALTSGGTPIVLTNNGSGTIQYPSFITGITPNTNFSVDVPASASGTVTLTARLLDTSLALFKGWTVTG